MQLKTILAFGALASTTLSIEINCKGSLRCVEDGFQPDEKQTTLQKIEAALANGVKYHERNRVYESGVPIVCTGTTTVCAFFQNGARGTPVDALRHVRKLLEFGCTACGSNPTRSENGGDEGGELTVNYRFIQWPYCEEMQLCPLKPDPDGTREEQVQASKAAMKCRLGWEELCED